MLQEYPRGQSCLFGPRPQKTFGRGTPIWHFGSFAISEFLHLGHFLNCMKKKTPKNLDIVLKPHSTVTLSK